MSTATPPSPSWILCHLLLRGSLSARVHEGRSDNMKLTRRGEEWGLMSWHLHPEHASCLCPPPSSFTHIKYSGNRRRAGYQRWVSGPETKRCLHSAPSPSTSSNLWLIIKYYKNDPETPACNVNQCSSLTWEAQGLWVWTHLSARSLPSETNKQTNKKSICYVEKQQTFTTLPLPTSRSSPSDK